MIAFLARISTSILRAAVVLGVAFATLSGCPRNHDGDDDGGVASDADVTSTLVASFKVEGGSGVDWSLVEAGILIDELVVHGDLGAPGDLHVSALGLVSLKPDSSRIVGEVAPATYSQITLALDSADASPTWEFEFIRGSGQVVVIRSHRALVIEPRCEIPASPEPDIELNLELALDGAGLVALVDGAGIAMAPGTMVLDETNADGLVSSIEAFLTDGFSLACEAD